MAEPSYATMTIDELDVLSVQLKQEQFAIRAKRREILAERTRKIIRQRLGQALKGVEIPANLTDQEVVDLLAEARKTKKAGDVVVTPAPGELRAQGGEPNVGGAA